MSDEPIYEADGLRLIVQVSIADGAGFSSFTGGTATVHAKRFNAGSVVGSAIISGPLEVTCTFAPWALDAGDWTVQVRVAPPAVTARTVGDYFFTVLPSITPRP